MKEYNIASIPGDGIGKEVVPEGLKVLKEAAQKHQFKINFTEYDFASCDYYEKHGKMLPDDWKEKLEKHDAIFFGAVGMPERVPDHISLWGSLLKFRREFDQYVNLRPVKLFPGINPPLANKKPGDIDMLIVRENTDGEYSSVGGRMFKDTDREIAVQETIMSAHGVDRVHMYALDSNGNPYSPSWHAVHLRLRQQWKRWQCSVAIENIFDRRYRPFASGISAPGRQLVVAFQTIR